MANLKVALTLLASDLGVLAAIPSGTLDRLADFGISEEVWAALRRSPRFARAYFRSGGTLRAPKPRAERFRARIAAAARSGESYGRIAASVRRSARAAGRDWAGDFLADAARGAARPGVDLSEGPIEAARDAAPDAARDLAVGISPSPSSRIVDALADEIFNAINDFLASPAAKRAATPRKTEDFYTDKPFDQAAADAKAARRAKRIDAEAKRGDRF